MLRVMPDLCKNSNANSMVVVLDGDQRGELTSVDARNLALQYARQVGFPARGLGGVPYPFPVNEAGETNEKLLMGQEKIASWRAEFTVNAGIGA